VVWSLHRQPVRQHEPHAVYANLLDLASSLLLPDDATMRSQVPVELQPNEAGILGDGLEDRPQIVLGASTSRATHFVSHKDARSGFSRP